MSIDVRRSTASAAWCDGTLHSPLITRLDLAITRLDRLPFSRSVRERLEEHRERQRQNDKPDRELLTASNAPSPAEPLIHEKKAAKGVLMTRGTARRKPRARMLAKEMP